MLRQTTLEQGKSKSDLFVLFMRVFCVQQYIVDFSTWYHTSKYPGSPSSRAVGTDYNGMDTSGTPGIWCQQVAVIYFA